MKRAPLLFAATLSSFVLCPPAMLFSQPCDTQTLPNGTVIEADDLQYDGTCIVVPRASTVTINGPHLFQSVVVEAGGIVTHAAIDRIDWVVEGDVTVAGSIDVTGKGLFGANAEIPGEPAQTVDSTSTCDELVLVEGAGALAGGSHGGRGSVCENDVCAEDDSGAVYGNIDSPCLPGSGGGACIDGKGGNGGGVVRIEALTIAVNGQILANGDYAVNLPEGAGGGSGGSIYLKAQSVTGNGFVRAQGGSGAFSYGGGGGGGGRIAIEVTQGLSLPEARLDASGGAGGKDCPPGEVGSVWIKVGDASPTLIFGSCGGQGRPELPPLPALAAIGRLVVRGPVGMTDDAFTQLTPKPDVLEVRCNAQLTVMQPLALGDTDLLLDQGEVIVGPEGVLTLSTFDETVAASGTLRLEGTLAVESSAMTIPRLVAVEQIGEGVKLMGDGGLLEDLTIAAGASIRHVGGAGNEVRLQATDRIDVLGLIDVTGRGLFGANKDGSGAPAEAVDPTSTCEELVVVDGAGALAGGSYGGRGGSCDNGVCTGGDPNATYGSLELPCFPGSGGGSCVDGQGGDGGGVVFLEAGTIVVNGQITADGGSAPNLREGAGGGSGGSVYLKAVSVTGNGLLSARGGAGAFSYGGGGGGGGRITIDVEAGSGLNENRLDASGGDGWQGCSPGQVGSIVIRAGNRAPSLIFGACGGHGQPDLPPIPEIEAIDRLVVRGPIRLTGDAFEALTPRPQALEVRCAAELHVVRPLALDETALYLEQGVVVVDSEGILTLPSFDDSVATSGTLRLAGPLAVRSPSMTIPRLVSVEQIGRGVKLMGDGGLVEDLTVAAGAVITHPPGGGNEVRLEASHRIDLLGGIDVTGKGLRGANKDRSGEPAEAVHPASTCDAVTVVEGAGYLAGGSHGGPGGLCDTSVCVGGESNALYGSLETPCLPGSGGGACIDGQGGNGGGVVAIKAGTITVNGYIFADGESATNLPDGAGGGSGGSIYLDALIVTVNGLVRAEGGGGAFSYGGGGGSGGRVGIDYVESMSLRQGAVSVAGGNGGKDCAAGADGTISTRDVEEPAAGFHRGDPNNSGTSDITDAVGLLNYLFANAASPSCLEAADINDDGTINITDPIGLLEFLFGTGAPPAPPGPPGLDPCGLDPPGSTDLGCEEYTHC